MLICLFMTHSFSFRELLFTLLHIHTLSISRVPPLQQDLMRKIIKINHSGDTVIFVCRVCTCWTVGKNSAKIQARKKCMPHAGCWVGTRDYALVRRKKQKWCPDSLFHIWQTEQEVRYLLRDKQSFPYILNFFFPFSLANRIKVLHFNLNSSLFKKWKPFQMRW